MQARVNNHPPGAPRFHGGSASVALPRGPVPNPEVKGRIKVRWYLWDGLPGTRRRITSWHFICLQLLVSGQWQVWLKDNEVAPPIWTDVSLSLVRRLGVLCGGHPCCPGEHQHLHPFVRRPPGPRARRVRRRLGGRVTFLRHLLFSRVLVFLSRVTRICPGISSRLF